MRFRMIAFFTLLLLALLSACGTGALQTQFPKPASPMPTGQPVTTIPAPLQPAQSYLAKTLGVPLDQISLQSYQPVEWSDSCLGVHKPSEMCAQVITPGFKAIFSTPQGEVEVHTNKSGDSFRLALALEPGGESSTAVVWERSGGIAGVCQIMTIDTQGAYTLKDCNADRVISSGTLSPDQMAGLNNYLESYATVQWQSKAPPGSADMFNDQFTLYGKGTRKPVEEQEQSINEFLSNLASQLQSAGPTSGTSESGIEGQALAGPTCPGPVRAGQVCPDKPYQATIIIFDQSNQMVKQFQTSAEGQFKVSLAPGIYILHPESTGTLPRAADQNVTVTKGQYTQVQITFDTGIR